MDNSKGPCQSYELNDEDDIPFSRELAIFQCLQSVLGFYHLHWKWSHTANCLSQVCMEKCVELLSVGHMEGPFPGANIGETPSISIDGSVQN